MPRELNTDINGNVVMKPLAAWAMHYVADVAVLLVVEYLDDASQAETMWGETLQLTLTPEQCLDFANSLTKAANGILHSPIPIGARFN